MVCPKCGRNMSWREASCPHCGAANPTQQKEKAKKKKDRVPNLIILGIIALLVLVLVLVLIPGKDDAPELVPDRAIPELPLEEEPAPSDTEAPEDTTEALPIPEQTGPDGEFLPSPENYESLEAFAQSPDCARVMAANRKDGTGVPVRYAVVDLNGDGTQELLVVSGETEGYGDTLVFTEDLKLSFVISSFGDVLLDPQEQALAYLANQPQGTPSEGGYLCCYDYFKLHAASGALYPLYSLTMDEGIPQLCRGEISETLTVNRWQEYIDRLQAPAWKSLSN